MPPTQRHRRDRGEVARQYGHPWPWYERELVVQYAVDRDVELRELAESWGVTPKRLKIWIRRHGFRVEQHRAVR